MKKLFLLLLITSLGFSLFAQEKKGEVELSFGLGFSQFEEDLDLGIFANINLSYEKNKNVYSLFTASGGVILGNSFSTYGLTYGRSIYFTKSRLSLQLHTGVGRYNHTTHSGLFSSRPDRTRTQLGIPVRFKFKVPIYKGFGANLNASIHTTKDRLYSNLGLELYFRF